MHRLNASFNRRVVRASVGDLLRLDLPENVTAGSRWALPPTLPRQLRLVSDKTAGQVSDAVGERRLEFRVVAGGRCSLSLVNARAWRQGSSSFEVLVDAYDADSEALAGPASSPQ